MDAGVMNFIESLINFCKCALEIPIQLYTKGLAICPWVPQWLEMIKTNYGVDIMGILPDFQNIINELEELSQIIGQI